jgi:hypothetical protein
LAWRIHVCRVVVVESRKDSVTPYSISTTRHITRSRNTVWIVGRCHARTNFKFSSVLPSPESLCFEAILPIYASSKIGALTKLAQWSSRALYNAERGAMAVEIGRTLAQKYFGFIGPGSVVGVLRCDFVLLTGAKCKLSLHSFVGTSQHSEAYGLELECWRLPGIHGRG